MDCNFEAFFDLQTASSLGDLITFQNIISHYGPDLIYRKNLEGWTPLMYAVYFNHIQIVEFILSLSSQDYLKTKNHKGQNALMLGAYNGYEEMIMLLLDKNILLLEESDFDGRDALSYAMDMKQDSCIHILLEYKTFYAKYKHKKNIKEELKALPSTETCDNEFQQEPLLLRIFKHLNLEKYWPNFEMLNIDFDAFIKLNEEDLKDLGIQLMGPRKKMIKIIQDYNKTTI